MRRDDAYLLYNLLAAQKALKFVEGINRNQFEDNEIIQNAVMRPLEIIGEAAAKISKEFRKTHSEIPWKEMVGMRNRLVHEYFRIDLGAVWDTIHKDLPKLIEIIKLLVPEEDEI